MSNELIAHADAQEGQRLATADLVKPAQPSDGRTTTSAEQEALFRGEESERFRNGWHDIQGSFVDEPRQAVEKADELVAAVIKRLAEVFAEERAKLEGA